VRRGLLIIAAATALFGCGGEIGAVDEKYTESFDAVVQATPEKVQPGQWVKFQLQVTNKFSKPMQVDLFLRLVEDATNKVVFTQRWESVRFELDEVYNISQNYLSATDTKRTLHRVELEARSVETGEVVWTDVGATIIEFGTN
jgi:hypothetical protein